MTEDVPPIVTTLTTDPETGGGGGEGRVYTAEVAASGREATTSGLEVGVQKATSRVASSLRIPEGSDVIFRHEKRMVDGLPWSLQTSFYPRSLADRAPPLLDTDDIAEGAVAYLRQPRHRAGRGPATPNTKCGTRTRSRRNSSVSRPTDASR